MKSPNRLALMLYLALAAGVTSPAVAEGLFAQSGKVIELIRAGKYNEALPLAQAMVADQEKRLPSRDLAGALNNLAEVYSGMGRDAEAEPLYKRALGVMEKSGGLDSVDMAPELTNLAALYERQSRYAEAEPLFKRARAPRKGASAGSSRYRTVSQQSGDAI
jgi:tetratricopeptide (TPR) repeat protein